MTSELLVETWRGDLVENRHRGHIAVVGPNGDLMESWGDPTAVIYPRSSCKMIQALPLVESGAAERARLGGQELALCCASHHGSPKHTKAVSRWMKALGLSEADLRCGPRPPALAADRQNLRDAGEPVTQLHNPCSGKHAGFLTLAREMSDAQAYIDPGHELQKTVRAAFEEMTGEVSPGFGIDGCSAPNFACSVQGLARAAQRMSRPLSLGSARSRAAETLVSAMITHPEMVAGTSGACTDFIAAANGQAAVKFGADGVYVGIFPQIGVGLALKIEDGSTAAAECAMAAMLVRLGVVDRNDYRVKSRLEAPIPNRNGWNVAGYRATI